MLITWETTECHKIVPRPSSFRRYVCNTSRVKLLSLIEFPLLSIDSYGTRYRTARMRNLITFTLYPHRTTCLLKTLLNDTNTAHSGRIVYAVLEHLPATSFVPFVSRQNVGTCFIPLPVLRHQEIVLVHLDDTKPDFKTYPVIRQTGWILRDVFCRECVGGWQNVPTI